MTSHHRRLLWLCVLLCHTAFVLTSCNETDSEPVVDAEELFDYDPNWSMPTNLKSGPGADFISIAAAADNQGNALVVWREVGILSTTYSVKAARYTRATDRWTTQTLKAEFAGSGPGPQSALNPSKIMLSMNGDGNAIAAWRHSEDPNAGFASRSTMTATFVNGVWSIPQIISDLAAEPLHVAIDESGNGVIAGQTIRYAASQGAYNRNVWTRRFVNGVWQPADTLYGSIQYPNNILSSFQEGIRIATHSSSDIQLIWQDLAHVGPKRLFASRYNGSIWSTPAQISASSTRYGQTNLNLLRNASGAGYTATWMQGDAACCVDGGTPMYAEFASSWGVERPLLSAPAMPGVNLVSFLDRLNYKVSTWRSVNTATNFLAGWNRGFRSADGSQHAEQVLQDLTARETYISSVHLATHPTGDASMVVADQFRVANPSPQNEGPIRLSTYRFVNGQWSERIFAPSLKTKPTYPSALAVAGTGDIFLVSTENSRQKIIVTRYRKP